jgi:hypothetical protein
MVERHATREPHIASTSGSVDRARKSGDWLRMQCLPMARGLPFKQDAVSACPRVAAAFDKIHRSVWSRKAGETDDQRDSRIVRTAGSGRPAMLTKMTDADWITVLRVFENVRSRRGDKGRDARSGLLPIATQWRRFGLRCSPSPWDLGGMHPRGQGAVGAFRRDCVRRSLGKCSLSTAPWVLCFPGRRPAVGEDLEINE